VDRVFLLLAGHFVCDFVLQSDAMGAGKSRRRAACATPGPDAPPWWAWLAAHAFTHGVAVYLITAAWPLGLLESALHAGIDHLKCERRISIGVDQALHLACKGLYLVLLAQA